MIRVVEIVTGSNTETFADDGVFITVHAAEKNAATASTAALAHAIRDHAPVTPSDLQKIAEKEDVESTIIYSKGTTLFCAVTGNAAIFIKRGNRFATLLEGTRSASGPLKLGDCFICASSSFVHDITKPTLSLLAQSGENEQLEQQLIEHVKKINTSEKSVCMLLMIAREPEKRMVNRIFKLPSTRVKRATLLIGSILLVLLAVSLTIGTRQKQLIKQQQMLHELTQIIQPKLTEAESLLALSPSRAEPILKEIHSFLETATSSYPEESEARTQLEALKLKTAELLSRATRTFTISEPPLFFDVHWIKEEGIVTKLATTEKRLALLDTDNGAVYELSIPEKKPSLTTSGEELKTARAITISAEHIYLAVGDRGTTIIDENKRTVIKNGELPIDTIDMTFYAGNLYIADRAGIIWKHAGVEGGGFTSAARWLDESITVDFTSTLDLSINGAIWVLKPTSILKFSLGGQDPFFLDNTSLTSAKALWASEETEELFVLENNRIVVLDKTGKYKEQYLWDGFSHITDIAVIDAGKTILLSDNTVVRSIERTP